MGITNQLLRIINKNNSIVRNKQFRFLIRFLNRVFNPTNLDLRQYFFHVRYLHCGFCFQQYSCSGLIYKVRIAL